MKPRTFVLIIKYLCIFILGVCLIQGLQPILLNYNSIAVSVIWLVVCVCNFELDS